MALVHSAADLRAGKCFGKHRIAGSNALEALPTPGSRRRWRMPHAWALGLGLGLMAVLCTLVAIIAASVLVLVLF